MATIYISLLEIWNINSYYFSDKFQGVTVGGQTVKPVTLVRNLITSLAQQGGMSATGQPFTVLPTNSSQSSQPTAILQQSISSTLAGSQGLTLLSQQGGLQYVNAAGAASRHSDGQQSQTQFLVSLVLKTSAKHLN